MKHAIRSISGSNQSSARVVDGKLILSMPHAMTPIVWQMDLNQAKASALEVHENKDTGICMLVLKTPRGENTDIAPFEKRPQAVEALMAVSRALENAQGQIRPFSIAGGGSASNEAGRKPRSPGKWVAVILGVILLLVLINIWGALLPHTPASQDDTGAPISFKAPPPENGVPQSADDFLNSQ